MDPLFSQEKKGMCPLPLLNLASFISMNIPGVLLRKSNDVLGFCEVKSLLELRVYMVCT